MIDQDVYHLTIEFLIRGHHDVIPVKQLALERAPDILLLRKAKEMERIFVTRDKDFGTLVFFEEEASCGVIFLRGKPQEIELIHSELAVVLENHTELELKKYFPIYPSVAKVEDTADPAPVLRAIGYEHALL